MVAPKKRSTWKGSEKGSVLYQRMIALAILLLVWVWNLSSETTATVRVSSTDILLLFNSTTNNNYDPNPVVPPKNTKSAAVASGRVAVESRSMTVIVQEEEIQQEYTNQLTEFKINKFSSSPSCDPLSESQVSFTLVTQASLDRMWIMKYHCQRWPPPYPISMAIYLPPKSTTDRADLEHELEVSLRCTTSRMALTILKGTSEMKDYPVNLLRNLAIRAASTFFSTSHIVYVDSDFLISDGLYADLMAMAPAIASDYTAAIVLPAFVYLTDCTKLFSKNNTGSAAAFSSCLAGEFERDVPNNKEDLLKLWAKPKTEHPNVKPGFHGVDFHSTTLYQVWKENQTLQGLPIPCIKNYLYEPYLAVRLCNQLPEFPPIFKGYGWNKNIWIRMLLQKANYTLWQSPRGFVLHVPHAQSQARTIFKTNVTAASSSHAMNRYLEWFKQKVPNHPHRLPKCSTPKTKDKRKGPKKR